MTRDGPEPDYWFPPARVGRIGRWLVLVLTSATLLTNAYYLSFAEPLVSRKPMAVAVILLSAAWFAVSHYGIPRSREALGAAARQLSTPLLLGLILAVAFGLRLWGSTFGLPQSYVPDEYDYVHSYLQMIKRGDLNPHWWYHPSLQPYVNVATFLAVFFLQVPTGRWSSVHQLTVEDMLFWGRFGVGVIVGTATVLVTFFLARRLFGTRVGLMAAAFLAVFPGAVEVSQYNKPDPLLTLMVAVSVLVTLGYLSRGGTKLAFASGLAIGLTVAAKYNGALVLIPFALAVVVRHGRQFLTRPDLYLGAAGSVVGFFAGCPYFIAELPKFIDQVANGLYTYGFAGREGAEGVHNWYNHAVYTIRYGAGRWAFLAGLGGLAIALYRLDGRLAVFLTFPVLYYSFYSSQRINFPGNLIPVYPFLAVLAAYGIDESVRFLAHGLKMRVRPLSRLPVEAFAVVTLLILALWFPVEMSIRHNRLVTLPDTGTYARKWIDTHFSPGTHFAVERHTPVLDPKRYKITMESRVINRAVRDLRTEGVQYLVVSSTVYSRFSPEHRQSQNYEKLFRICPQVAEFKPVEGKLYGPTIRILSVPAE